LELQWHATSDIIFMSGLIASGINTNCLSCLSATDESWEISVPENPARYYLVDCTGTLGTTASRNRDVVEVSHTVSAKGYNCCNVSGIFSYGWETAKEWVLDRIGYTSSILTDISGAFYFVPGDFTTYNHSRTVSVNKGNGDFAVNERWTVLGNSGVPACLEDFSINVETDNSSRFTNVSINGTITGLESRNSQFAITAATNIKNTLLGAATEVYSTQVTDVNNQRMQVIELFKAEVAKAQLTVQAQIAEIETALGGYTAVQSLRERVANAKADLGMQGYASAVGSVNMNASLSHQTGRQESESYNHSENRQISYSRDIGLSESHNFEEDPSV